MNQASLYQRANNVQRRDAKQILDQYAQTIRWRPDGRDTVLDVGCGSGDVMMDFLYPMLPENFEKLLGTDISTKMVNYARKVYDSDERVKFDVLDIGSETLPVELCEQFDHITSFYCLHWVQGQRIALQNIYKLLRREGGDCLLVFLATNPIYDVYKILSKSNKWSSFMTDVDRFIAPLHFEKDPGLAFQKLLNDVGFVDYNIEVRDELYVYEGEATVKNNIKAICPFLERIPAKQHDDFMEDVLSAVASLKLREPTDDMRDYRFITPYKLVVAYARKSDGFLSKVIEGERESKGIE